MNILTREQEIAISLLAKSPWREKFYWTGGTLLAYHYLQHRKSLDIDFFSEKRFSFVEVNQLVQKLKKEAGFRKVSQQKIFDRWEFLFENEKVLRVEFVYYNKERRTLKKRSRLLGVYIDSLEDIAANKVIAYFDRNEPKDLFDLYFLLTKGGFSPQKLLKLARQKFDMQFPESLFWSESFKGLPLLKELKVLMIEQNDAKKEKLLRKIEDYFKAESEKFLGRSLV